MKGDLRREIMELCPDEFEGALKGWIDEIEGRIRCLSSDMEISCLGDLADLETAKGGLDDLADSLW